MGRKLNKKFLRITLEIMGAKKQRKFSGAESSIIDAIIEGTFGSWDPVAKEYRDRAEFPLSLLVAGTGLDRSAVQDALDHLISDRILIVHRNSGSHQSAIYGIEDHTSNWLRPTRTSVVKRPPNSVVKPPPKSGVKRPPNSVVKPPPYTGKTATLNGAQTVINASIPLAIDQVRLPSVVIDGADDCHENGSNGTSFRPYEEILRAVSPMPETRSPKEAVVLIGYVELTGWTQDQKLEALRQGVAETRAYLAKKPANGPVVCWAIDKATKHLATLGAEPEAAEVAYYQDNGKPGWWEEPARLWEERQAREQAEKAKEEPHGT